MEEKKSPPADLANKKNLFFSIGLVSSLALGLMAFEWKQYDSKLDLLSGKSTNTFEEMIEVPLTEQLPPPATPLIQQPQIIEVPDEEEIKVELNTTFDVEAARAEEHPPQDGAGVQTGRLRRRLLHRTQAVRRHSPRHVALRRGPYPHLGQPEEAA